jgi:hypothetical protein
MGAASTDRRHSFFTGFFLTMPFCFRINSTINVSSGSPFNITTGADDNGDLTINDQPAGINRNSGLPAHFYSQLPDRLICPPIGGACNPGGSLTQLRDFLVTSQGEILISRGIFQLFPDLTVHIISW